MSNVPALHTCFTQLPSLTARLPAIQHVAVGRQDDAQKMAGRPNVFDRLKQ